MGAMQISDSPLAEAGRRYFSAADAETWTGLLRPGFHLRALTQGESVAAYLGGAFRRAGVIEVGVEGVQQRRAILRR